MKRGQIRAKDLQIQDTKRSFRFIILVLLIVFIILSFLGILLTLSEKKEVAAENKSSEEIKAEDKEELFFSSDGATRIKMYLPAVNEEGNGVNTILTVEASRGSGRTLTDIDNLLFWADTQHSIRIARKVAENITGKKMEDYNIVYTIEANASLIGGPSAGAALTIATITVLEGKKLNENVMITGSINHDGSIGPVESILAKAQVAKEANVSVLLVPLLQSREVIYEIKEHCEKFGTNDLCTSEQIPKRVNVSEETGVQVIEVGSIQEAMKYFFE